MTYELASLALGTRYDVPIRTLAVPGAVSAEQGLAMMDGARPDRAGLARITHDHALLSLVVPAGADLLVTVEVGADWTAFVNWRRARDDGPGDESGRHRAVAVSAGGGTSAVVVLVRRPEDGRLLQRVTLPVAADRVTSTGRVLLVLEEPAGLPRWARDGLLEDPLVGLLVTSVSVAPGDGGTGARLSSGRPRRRQPLEVPAAPGLLVVNPGPACRLRIWPAEEVARAQVELTSADGTTLDERQANRVADGGFATPLSALAAPLYVRARADGHPIAWRAGLRPA